MHSFRVTPAPPLCVCDFINLILSFQFDILHFGSFAIVFSYCFTSEIQESVFLSQKLTTSWHLIQFPVAYLGRPFRYWWLQTVGYFTSNGCWGSLAMQILRIAILGEQLRWLLWFLRMFCVLVKKLLQQQ